MSSGRRNDQTTESIEKAICSFAKYDSSIFRKHKAASGRKGRKISDKGAANEFRADEKR